MALHAPSVLPLEKVQFFLALYADHGLGLINWPYVNLQRVFMIGRSCFCPKGWPAFILHWMKGSKLKGKSSNWWGGIQSKDKQWQLSQIVGLLKDKSSLNRLSSFWDRHSIVIGWTGSMYRGLLTRTGTGKGEGRALLSVTVRGVGGVGGSDWPGRSHQTTDKKLSPYFLPHTGPQTHTSYHAQLWVWSVEFHIIYLSCIPGFRNHNA